MSRLLRRSASRNDGLAPTCQCESALRHCKRATSLQTGHVIASGAKQSSVRGFFA
ncbi:MAG: hypothetical protein LBT00_13515 [Spirochaetaceae bacterium]|nr:hypothetical protein [Spirochaetaceae bacterium]